MNKKVLAYSAILPVLGLALFGAQTASAHGPGGMDGGFGMGFGLGTKISAEDLVTRHQAMFTDQANLLGISVDEVKAAWANGKTLPELAKEKNITEAQLQAKLKAAREAQVKADLQTLVSKGVITQAQADARLAVMQKKFDTQKTHNGLGKKFMKMRAEKKQS